MTGWNADLGDAIGTGRFGDVTLLDGSTFAVSSRTGDFTGQTHGLYLLDTRILHRCLLRVDGRAVEPLSTVSAAPFTCRFVGRVPRPGGPVDSPLIVIPGLPALFEFARHLLRARRLHAAGARR